MDLGCGTVPLYEAYRALVSAITCVDWGESRHGAGYRDFDCDLNEPLPFADASFDTAVLSDVLEHVRAPAELLRRNPSHPCAGRPFALERAVPVLAARTAVRLLPLYRARSAHARRARRASPRRARGARRRAARRRRRRGQTSFSSCRESGRPSYDGSSAPCSRRRASSRCGVRSRRPVNVSHSATSWSRRRRALDERSAPGRRHRPRGALRRGSAALSAPFDRFARALDWLAGVRRPSPLSNQRTSSSMPSI